MRNNDGEGELSSFKKKTYKKLLPKAMTIQQGEKQYNPLTQKTVEINNKSPTASVITKKKKVWAWTTKYTITYSVV